MPDRSAKLMRRLAFALGGIAGFLLWYLSLPLTGNVEPWDSESVYYPVALLLAGGIAGLVPVRPLRWWFWLYPVGIFSGQLLAILTRSYTHPPAGANMLFPIGVMFLAAASLLSLFGALPVAWVLGRKR